MRDSRLKSGIINVKIIMLNPDRILNILWSNGIKVTDVRKVDVTTIFFNADYGDYNDIKDAVLRCGGKIKITGTKGGLFLYLKAKRSISLVIGGILFLCIIYYLSTFIWSVEINTIKNVSPYEIRKILYQNGITPGISKDSLDVKAVETLIEDQNKDVLWVRARIEGSSLRILIEEKVNPPIIEVGEYGDLVASMDGEVSRVYTYSGRAVVSEGQMVNKGDILIEGIIGSEGNEVEVPARGVIIANTFVEKSMVVQTSGTIKERSGNKDTEIYLNILGKKFYLKKAIKDFKDYDRIEEQGNFICKNTYYEKIDKEVKLSKEEAVEKATIELENSLLNELTREAKIVDKVVNVDEDEDNNVIVSIAFVIEQNIVDNFPVED